MPHSVQKLAEDALTACAELKHFTSGKQYVDLLNDRGLQLIVERLFEVIGDGARSCVDGQCAELAP
jgi:uncharacterized protein with HEPN domain